MGNRILVVAADQAEVHRLRQSLSVNIWNGQGYFFSQPLDAGAFAELVCPTEVGNSAGQPRARPATHAGTPYGGVVFPSALRFMDWLICAVIVLNSSINLSHAVLPA